MGSAIGAHDSSVGEYADTSPRSYAQGGKV